MRDDRMNKARLEIDHSMPIVSHGTSYIFVNEDGSRTPVFFPHGKGDPKND